MTDRKLQIAVALGNEAFTTTSEISRILAEIAEKIEGGQVAGTARDINGNTCGTWEIVRERKQEEVM